MAKWKSALFSDIRNRLGNQVVFAVWKGRGYFRKYVIPSNPRTLKQQANRDQLRKLVEQFKSVVDTEDKKTAWDQIGLLFNNVSGYNAFMKIGRKSKIACDETGTVGSAITITYTVEVGIDLCGIVVKKPDGSLEIVVDKGNLETGENKTATYTPDAEGEYIFYIACLEVLLEGDTSPKPYQLVNAWKPDYTQGIAVMAKCTVST